MKSQVEDVANATMDLFFKFCVKQFIPQDNGAVFKSNNVALSRVRFSRFFAHITE